MKNKTAVVTAARAGILALSVLAATACGAEDATAWRARTTPSGEDAFKLVHARSRDYLKQLIAQGVVPRGRFMSSWTFGNEDQSVELAKLVIAGKKTATSSLGWLYTVGGERKPEVGDISVVTDNEGNPFCVVEDTEVVDLPFHRVSAEHAAAEGEGDLSLDYWRKVHWKFFSHDAATLKKTPAEDMPVTTERLRLVNVKQR